MSESSLKELANLREEVELRLELKALKSSNIQLMISGMKALMESEVDELRKEVVQLRRQADYNSDEITKLQESLRKEGASE